MLENESCDDGNAIDSDGCSSMCEVEYGYDCSSGKCIYKILPKVESYSISADNSKFQVKFSQTVKTLKDLSKSNFKISILANNSNYDVEWNLETSLISEQQINEFFFEIGKIDKPIVRETDKIKISFKKDLFVDEWGNMMEA